MLSKKQIHLLDLLSINLTLAWLCKLLPYNWVFQFRHISNTFLDACYQSEHYSPFLAVKSIFFVVKGHVGKSHEMPIAKRIVFIIISLFLEK